MVQNKSLNKLSIKVGLVQHVHHLDLHRNGLIRWHYGEIIPSPLYHMEVQCCIWCLDAQHRIHDSRR